MTLNRALAHFRPPIIGYEHPTLVDWIFTKTLRYNPRPKRLAPNIHTVLDFGGGASAHYILSGYSISKWAIVETPAMVRKCKPLETLHLRWFTNIADAASWLGHVDLLHCDGALQYTADPLWTAAALLSTMPRYKHWERLAFTNNLQPFTTFQSSYLSANGPGILQAPVERIVKYPMTLIPRKAFEELNRD